VTPVPSQPRIRLARERGTRVASARATPPPSLPHRACPTARVAGSSRVVAIIATNRRLSSSRRTTFSSSPGEVLRTPSCQAPDLKLEARTARPGDPRALGPGPEPEDGTDRRSPVRPSSRLTSHHGRPECGHSARDRRPIRVARRRTGLPCRLGCPPVLVRVGCAPGASPRV
jgi:hypothetical protein